MSPGWRGVIEEYRSYLPVSASTPVVTLHEGGTPLLPAPRLSERVGAQVWLKIEGANPTGSFKDRGMTVAISKALEEGAKAVVCGSTGNTSASAAAYAARAGLTCAVLIPEGYIALGKLAQALIHGARVLQILANFDVALDIVRQLGNEAPVTVVNSINPYRIEGQKCAAFAILEARGWNVPDWVVLPGGNLGNISAISKGFREALQLGLIDKLPRLALVRAERGVDTTASAIAVGNPKSRKRASRALERFNGIELCVSDEAILDAKAHIGREGIGCEPASAASLAGARALRASGDVAPDADVVAILTGHILKDARVHAYAVA